MARARHQLIYSTAAILLLSLAGFGRITQASAAFPGSNGRIAFVASTTSCTTSLCAQGVFTMEPSGEDAQELTRHRELAPVAAYDTGPTYSPNGRRLAFTRNFEPQGSPDPTAEIRVTRADGTGQRVVLG